MNVQCRSNDYDNMKTTVMKLPTDFVELTEPTLSRVSPVVAKEAHTDGTTVVQYQSDDQNSMKTTIMQMPMDYLEIPEPSLPRGFLELADEARNVITEGRVDKTGSRDYYGVQFVCTEGGSYDSSRNLCREDTTRFFSAGRCYPADQLGLVGPWDKTEQSVLPGSDAKDEGTDPAGPVGPDVSVDQIQPVAEGLVGQYITRSPVGPDGMLFTCDSDQPMAEGPVGQHITHNPVGSDGMLSTCDSDQPVADGPVGPSFILGPVGPRRMCSQCRPDQPVAVGPVGQSFTPGPVGPCGIVSKCELNDPIADSPVGSTETPDPVDQRERPIQIEIMKIVTTDEPASLVETPPSSDSGIHSWGEQWENMSISTADTEAEQNGRPRICSPMVRRVSDTRVPPNTEEDEVIICPWMDCLLKRESDESSSGSMQHYNKDPQCNENMDFNSDREPTDESLWENYEACSDDLEIISKEGAPAVPRTEFQTQIRNETICRKENSSVGSGTDGRNSDIGDLADFLSDEEESQVEQFAGCRIPGCQCEGRIKYMEWDSDDMTDSEDSEWEDPDERANRLWVEQYNFDLLEGMLPMTYTPPSRKNRRRRYEDKKKMHRKYKNHTVVLVR